MHYKLDHWRFVDFFMAALAVVDGQDIHKQLYPDSLDTDWTLTEQQIDNIQF